MNTTIRGQEYKIYFDHDGVNITHINRIVLITGTPANEITRDIVNPSYRLYQEIETRLQDNLDKVNAEYIESLLN